MEIFTILPFQVTHLKQLTVTRDESTIPNIRPAVSSHELSPIPSPPPLPDFPDTGFCQWSYDKASRVLLAKFLPFKGEKLFGKILVNPEDERFPPTHDGTR